MPGLLVSWTDFDLYMTCNIQATQRLLEAARAAGTVHQLIHASTSSIYGSYVTGPETTPPQPISPYGITKLAAENLVLTYQRQYGLAASIVRYFSVYGPRQRPDMGYNIFIERILRGQTIPIFGDGSQRRGNAYVADAVRGTRLAHERFSPGAIYNIGGIEEVSAIDVIRLLEELIGQPARLAYQPPRPGEQERTLADLDQAHTRLGFTPQMPLRDGLAAQVTWQRQLLAEQTV
jgi:nucleoside-diphosphate-sugar epimerase